MSGVRAVSVLCVLAMTAVACQSGGDDPGSVASAVPAISIGECQIVQGTQVPAAARGVDFHTQLREPGVLTVGSGAPASSSTKAALPAGIPAGFEADLFTEIAGRLGLRTEVATASTERLLARSIPRGTVDVGMSALLIEENRTRTVDFTAPYFQADLSLIVDVERTPEVEDVDDLPGKTIGVRVGTPAARCAASLVRLGVAKESKPYPDPESALRALTAGHVAVVIGDRPTFQALVEKTSTLRVVQAIETRAQYGIAVSKRKPDLRIAVQGALTAIMNDGTYAQIYEKWFGTKPPFAVPIR